MWFTDERYLPGLQMATFYLCPQMTERELWSLPLLLRTLIPSGKHFLIISLKPNYPPKGPPPNTITVRLGVSTNEFWEDANIQSIIFGIIKIKNINLLATANTL